MTMIGIGIGMMKLKRRLKKMTEVMK